MQVIRITGYGGIDRLQRVTLPDPRPGPGEVAIAVRAFGVNFADVLARVGLYVQAPRPPFVPGFEVAGTVAALGEGVTTMQPGDRVVCLTPFGGYADRIVVPAQAAAPMPDAMSYAEAAALPVVGVTAYHALLVQGGLAAGDTVLIQAAAGGVGLAAVQLARHAGARVIGVCGGPRKAAFLRDFGVEHVVDHQNEDLAARVAAITAGQGLDVILDSVGGAFIAGGLRMLRAGGRFVSIGAAAFAPVRNRNLLQLLRTYLSVPRLHPLRLLGQSKSFIGVQMLVLGKQQPAVLRRSLEAVLAEAALGRLQPVLADVLPPGRIGEAHRRLQGRETIGKLIITWDQQ